MVAWLSCSLRTADCHLGLVNSVAYSVFLLTAFWYRLTWVLWLNGTELLLCCVICRCCCQWWHWRSTYSSQVHIYVKDKGYSDILTPFLHRTVHCICRPVLKKTSKPLRHFAAWWLEPLCLCRQRWMQQQSIWPSVYALTAHCAQAAATPPHPPHSAVVCTLSWLHRDQPMAWLQCDTGHSCQSHFVI